MKYKKIVNYLVIITSSIIFAFFAFFIYSNIKEKLNPYNKEVVEKYNKKNFHKYDVRTRLKVFNDLNKTNKKVSVTIPPKYIIDSKKNKNSSFKNFFLSQIFQKQKQ
jgi:hypothetical protein